MNKTIIKEIEKKEKAEILDIEIKSFSKNLKKDDLKIVDETIKLVEDQTNGLVKGATTDLQLVYNFSVKMKNLLPLNNMVKGTDIKQFGKIEKFTTAHVKKFTNVVLCYVMGKNPDTINSEDPYFYKVLRNIATSVIFQLKHDAIKHVENNAFNNPIGRKPKQINISMSMVNQHEDLKKKFNSGGGAMDYVSFETFNEIANYFVLGKTNNEDSRSKLLKLLDPLYNYLVDNKFLAKDLDNRNSECEKIHFVISDLLLLLDSENKFEEIADIKTFIDDETIEDGLSNYHNHIDSFNKDNNEIKNVSFVKINNGKPLYVKADTGQSFLKQLASK
tara:strand:+ start:61 stop:1056 length:996 start_codon:yes stop_codon:yes gene_type:complete